jgi:hypothetical protein
MMARVALAVVSWCVATIFLWSPGIGNVAVTHIHYFKEAYGPFSYHSRETRGGIVVQYGLNYFNLFVTLCSSLLVSASLLYEIGLYRQKQRETN